MSNGNPNAMGVTPIVRTLIIINVALWLLTIGAAEFDINLTRYLGLYNFDSPFFRPWQLFTHLFMHDTQEPFHLFFNMLGLWMFGSQLERYWNPKRFLLYFLITGIGAGVVQTTVTSFQIRPMYAEAHAFHQQPTYDGFEKFTSSYLPGTYDNEQLMEFMKAWYYDNTNPGYEVEAKLIVSSIVSEKQNTVNVGASGALYGLLLAFGMLFPNAMIMMLIPPIPMKAKYFVLVFGGIELFSGLRNNVDDNVAHFAHLGGMIFGILLILLWKKQDRKRNVFRL
jgi:membrane associated rhomboid family serine protease